MNKFHKELFFATSNKVIWPKQFFNCMHGLKSAILAISQKWADRLDRKWLYQLLPIKYELELPSEITPGPLLLRSRSK